MRSLSRVNDNALGGLPSGGMAGLFRYESRSGMFDCGWSFATRSEAERVWSLCKAENVVHAETNEHPLGYELRVYMNGHCRISLVGRTREQAELDAEGLRRAGLADGWADRPSA